MEKTTNDFLKMKIFTGGELQTIRKLYKWPKVILKKILAKNSLTKCQPFSRLACLLVSLNNPGQNQHGALHLKTGD